VAAGLGRKIKRLAKKKVSKTIGVVKELEAKTGQKVVSPVNAKKGILKSRKNPTK
jgi:hypothetical protein